MRIRQNLACCGVGEMHHLSRYGSPEDAMEAFADVAQKRRGRTLWLSATGEPMYSNNRGRAFILFTGVGGYTSRFARFIKDNGFGEVKGMTPRMNPNSYNTLQAFLWAPNWTKVNSWAKARKDQRDAAAQGSPDGSGPASATT